MPESFSNQEPQLTHKPDLDKIIKELENVPQDQPLVPVKESDFNPQYMVAMRAIFSDFASKNPELQLDPEVLLKEYICEYGIVTEQDHLDCLKLALRESLKHIQEGKKICILTHDNPYRGLSKKLMSKVLNSLIRDIAGEQSVVLVDKTTYSEHSIRESVKSVMEKDGLTGEDYRFVVIDDATYSGADFYGFVQKVKWNLEELVQEPSKSIDGFLAFGKDGMEEARLEGINGYEVRRTPDPVPVTQLQYFNDDLYGRDNFGVDQSKQTTIIPSAVVTAYKYPDHHSVLSFYKIWEANETFDIDSDETVDKLSDMVTLLVDKGILTAPVTAFESKKKYPTVEYLVSKVKEQMELTLK